MESKLHLFGYIFIKVNWITKLYDFKSHIFFDLTSIIFAIL